MINWTQPGAGLRNAGITSQQNQAYYQNALNNYRVAQQGPPKISNDVMVQRAQMNNLTRLKNPFDVNSGYTAAPTIAPYAPTAQQAATYRNADIAGRPITLLSGYMESQKQGPSAQIAKNIAANGLGNYQNWLAPARDWELRETVRSNVRKGGGIVGLGLKAAPAIMSWAGGGFPLPSVGPGAFSFAGLGSKAAAALKAAPANFLKSFTTPYGLSQQAQAALMRQR